MTTVLGIDPSLTRTAVAVIHPGLITLRDFPTKGTKADDLSRRSFRLNLIGGYIEELYDDITDKGHHPADLVVIEGPAHGQTTGSHHDRSGLWWQIVGDFLDLGIPVVEISPSSLKTYATGKGNAGKDEVMLAVARRYTDITEVANNDQADALVLAAMGARHLGAPIEASLPASHLRALDKVAWPAGLAVA